MAGAFLQAAGPIALIAAGLYQVGFQDVVAKFGVGRTVQPVSDFPYQCRRLVHTELQACEDMWLDDDNRQLYLACSNVRSRQHWVPNIGKLNESAIYMQDAVYVMDLNKPVGTSYSYRRLATPNFHGTAGEGSLHVLSVTGRKVPGSSKIELYLVNNKPSLSDATGAARGLAKNVETGANSTIELFEVEPGSSSMQHVRTFANPLIATPNNVAPNPDGSGFYITNDHGSSKAGLKHSISPYAFTGNVVYCTNPPRTVPVPPTCKIVATGMSFPNGLTIHPSDPKTLYVPSAALGKGLTIFKIHQADGSLTKLENLKVPYPIDNLSPSADGSIYAAAFPKVLQTMAHFDDLATFDTSISPADRKTTPAAMLRISKVKNMVNDGKEVTWMWEKVIEDAHGQILPTATVAVRDAKTGALFLSGILSDFVTINARGDRSDCLHA